MTKFVTNSVSANPVVSVVSHKEVWFLSAESANNRLGISAANQTFSDHLVLTCFQKAVVRSVFDKN